MDFQEIIGLAEPLEGVSPVGEDVKHDDDFTALEDELRKGEGINVQPIDWVKIEILAGKILKEQSKDLRVVGRLIAALFYRHNFAGLEAGFALLAKMLKADYWEQIHPARPKSRGASVKWAIQKIDRQFSEYETTLEQAETVINSAKAFAQVDALLGEKLGDKAPNLFEFRNVINRYQQEAEFLLEEAAKQAKEKTQCTEHESKTLPENSTDAEIKQPAQVIPEKKATPSPPVASEVPAHNPVAVSSAEDVAKALRSCGSTMGKVSHLLRNQKINDPYPFFILRSGVWMQLRETPPDGVLPAPPESKITALKQMEQNKDWLALIDECEKAFAGGQVCWLALHRFVANALEALGANDAAQAVKDAVLHLVSRLPEMLTRKFDNGEGFADEMTRSWIVSLRPQADSQSSTSEQGDAIDEWNLVADEAKQLAVNGDFDAGLLLFKEGIQSVASLREQAYWQLEQARFCFTAGHLEIAQPQLTYLHQTMMQKELQQWEPTLYLEVTKLLVNCHIQAQSKRKYTAEQLTQVDQLKAHLCLMDPLGALSIINN